MHGLMIYDLSDRRQDNVSFGNKADIIEQRTNGRIRPIHFGVNSHKDPLTFKIVFGSDKPLDRFDLEEIAYWLTGHQDYQWLRICQPDLDHCEFRAIITDLQPISIGWLPVAFEAQVRCDCPYAYGLPFSFTYPVNNSTTIKIQNRGSAREVVLPLIRWAPSGSSATSLSIVNQSDNGRTMTLTNLPANQAIVIDADNGLIYPEPYTPGQVSDLYGGFNDTWLQLVPGNNTLLVTGKGQITISGRCWHNVSA